MADVITRKSGDGKRLCRALLRYMLEHNWDTSVEIRRQVLMENGVIPLLQKQYREMYPGKVSARAIFGLNKTYGALPRSGKEVQKAVILQRR